MIADYYKDKVLDEKPETEKISKSLTLAKPQIKAGGSYKTYSIPNIDFCNWKIDNLPEDKYEAIVPYNSNQIKIKIVKDYNLIGTVFQLSAYSQGNLLDSIDIEVITI